MKKLKKKNVFFTIAYFILGAVLSFFIINNDSYYVEDYRNTGEFVYTSVYQDNILEQSFKSSVNKLETIGVKIATYGKKLRGDKLTLRLKDDTGKVIENVSVDTKKLKDNKYIEFNFPEIENSKNKYFTFELSCRECSKKEQIGIYGQNGIIDLEFAKIDGKESKYQTAMMFNGTTFNVRAVKIVSILLIITSLIFMYLKVDVDKMKKKHKILESKFFSLPVLFCLEFMFTFISILFFGSLIYEVQYNYLFPTIYLVLFLLFVHLLIFVSIYIIKSRKIKPENLFLLLAIPIGACYLTFMVPNYVADELIHYTSAYKITEGQLRDTGGYVKIPAQTKFHGFINLREYRKSNYYELDKYLRQAPTVEEVDSTATEYNLLLYVPQAIGIGIAKVLNLPYVLGYYFARVFNFISFLILGYLSIKIIPIGKFLAFTFLLNPMLIHQAVSVSADSLINSISVLFICYTLYASRKEEVLTKKERIILYTLILLISLIKYVYIPLVLLAIILLFKNKKLFDKKERRNLLIVISISIFICVLLYYLHSLIPISVVSIDITERDISFSGQLMNLIRNPLMIIDVLTTTLANQGTFYFETFLGARLGWLNIVMPTLLVIIYFVLLLLSPFIVQEKKDYTLNEKIWISLVFIIISMLIIFGLYLTWTPVASRVAEGIQGRYFIPIAILPFLLLCNKKRYLHFEKPMLWYSLILLFVHFNIVSIIINYFL